MRLWKMHDGSADRRVEDVVRYYIQRVQELEHYYVQSRNRIIVVGEDLVNEPNRTLMELSEHLDLPSPLLPDYKSYKFTGKGRYGDTSGLIKRGKIIIVKEDHSTFLFPEELGDLFQQSYDHFIVEAKS